MACQVLLEHVTNRMTDFLMHFNLIPTSQAIGMAAIPIEMIKGTQSVTDELEETDSAIQHTIRRRNAIKKKVSIHSLIY